MDLAQKVIEVFQEFGLIRVFCEFSDQIDKNIDCQKNHCDIKSFLEPLKEAIPDALKDYDSIRNLFIRQSVNYSNVFNCMFKLKSEKGNKGVIDLIEGLKIINGTVTHQEEEVEEKSEVRSLLDILVEQKKRLNSKFKLF